MNSRWKERKHITSQPRDEPNDTIPVRIQAWSAPLVITEPPESPWHQIISWCDHHPWSPDKCWGPSHTQSQGPGGRNTRSRRPGISWSPRQDAIMVTDHWGEAHLDILEVGTDPARVPLLAPAEDGHHVTGGGLTRLRESDGRYQAGDLRHAGVMRAGMSRLLLTSIPIGSWTMAKSFAKVDGSYPGWRM